LVSGRKTKRLPPHTEAKVKLPRFHSV